MVQYLALRPPTAGNPHRGVEARRLEGGDSGWYDRVAWSDGIYRPRFIPVDGTTLEPIAPCTPPSDAT